MDEKRIRIALERVLRDVQEKQGLRCPPLHAGVRPLKDLEQFDSPMSIFATAKIGRMLGINIPDGKNIFGDGSGAFSLSQTVTLLSGLSRTNAPQKVEA